MRVLVTAGATREYIDPVRYITNASSGRMGCAVAAAAVAAGHEATLLCGPGVAPPEGVPSKAFISVEDLQSALRQRFEACDALVMAAAVGDFRPEKPFPSKIHRSAGPFTLRLFPTEDILASLVPLRTERQVVIAFAVEDGRPEQMEAKARREMDAKGADYVVVNTPEAMAADVSLACILGRGGVVLPWAERPKNELAGEIVKLLASPR